MIPLTVVELDEEAIAAVAAVLRSGMLVQGAQVQAFEQALRDKTGRRHAIAVSSGTAALMLALEALNVGPGDEVLCPDLSWPSPAHAILDRGARPVLVDVDAHSWNASPATLKPARNERTRAAVIIEQFGNPAEHTGMAEALRGVPSIVDAACALGSRYLDQPCGSHGTIACLSFHPRKLLTTGEGGACLTDDDGIADRLRALRNHGQRNPGEFTCASGNYRLTEMGAALGLAQLAGFERRIERLRELAALYRTGLPELQFQRPPEGGQPNHQTLGVLLPEDRALDRDSVLAALRERGVGAARLSYALHDLPQLREAAASARTAGRRLDNARRIAQWGLALPLYPSMTEADVQHVVASLRATLEEA